MSKIKVNHQKMVNTAKQIDRYISKLEKNMNSMDTAVTSLGAAWKGVDYQQVRAEWEAIHSPGSTTDKMKCTLQRYADSLRKGAKEYQEAQAHAIDRANALCK